MPPKDSHPLASHNPSNTNVLVATLGSEAQVVTAGLDLLNRQGEKIQALHVLHTDASIPPISHALVTLMKEFDAPTLKPGLKFHLHPISTPDGKPFPDIVTSAASQAAFQCIYQVVRAAKIQGYRIHLLIAGGRKNLAIYGLVVAQMLFDNQDCLWHLYSSGDFLTSKRLHPQQGDDVQLVPIPVLLRNYISPALTGLRHIEDAESAVEYIRLLELEEKMTQARSFVLGALTPAEERVVSLLVREGLSDRQLAARLNLSTRTVEQQLRSAYGKAADHWELDSVNRAQLISILNLYYNIHRKK